MARGVLIALACLVIGCSDPEPLDDAEIATFEETDFSDDSDGLELATVRAVFLGPAFGGDAALVEHEEIPDRMPAMRMQVALERPDLIAGLEAGDKVTLTYRDYATGPGFVVTAIEPLPADTELDLDSAADSAFVPPGVES